MQAEHSLKPIDNTRQFVETCDKLNQIGFIQFMEECILNLLYDDIQLRMHRVCTQSFDETFLDQYFEWLSEFVGGWLSLITKDTIKIECWMNKLRFHMYTIIHQLRCVKLVDDYLTGK